MPPSHGFDKLTAGADTEGIEKSLFHITHMNKNRTIPKPYASCAGGQCHSVNKKKKRINREGHEEREEKKGILDKILRELRVLRGKKILILMTLGSCGQSQFCISNPRQTNQ